MPNAAYRNAANQERRVKARLEAQGWTVWRTPGSKSPADLVCVRRSTVFTVTQNDSVTYRTGGDPEVLLVQCKNGATPMSRPKREAFRKYAANLGAAAVLVEHGMKFTQLTEEAA